MTVGEVCTRDVYVVRKTETLAVAAGEMRTRHIGAVVVVEPEGELLKPIGMVTDRDIVWGQLAHRADLHSLSVADVMTSRPLTLAEDGGVWEAIERLRAKGVRRAPVVSERGDLVGIVSVDDLLPLVAEELLGLARLVGEQASHEAQSKNRQPRAREAGGS